MKIFATEGLVVRDPATMTRIPAEGLNVSPGDPHWSRLLRDGDVTEEAPEHAPEEAPEVPALGGDVHHEEDEA